MGERHTTANHKLHRDGTEPMMSKYVTEREIVRRFLALHGLANPELRDPNQGRSTDTGADVIWTSDRRVIRFQVTAFHSDEGRNPGVKGSQPRRNEKRRAAASNGGVYTMTVVTDPIPAIVARVVEKVQRAQRADRQRFDELILLIASSRPEIGGTAAGFLLDAALDLRRLTTHTHDLLSESAYTSAYMFNMLSLTGTPSVYRWDRDHGWACVGRSDSAHGGRMHSADEDIGLHTLRYLRSLGGPHPGPGSLSDGLDATFIPQLLEAFPDRDPTPEEINSFERAWRQKHQR